jgi:hypothetical protein
VSLPNAEMMKRQLVNKDVLNHHHQSTNVTVPLLQSENVEMERKLQHAEITKATLADKDVLHQIHVIAMLKQLEFVETTQLPLQLLAETTKRISVTTDVILHNLHNHNHHNFLLL